MEGQAEVVVDVEEEMRVGAGVVEHLFGKWADAPVCELVALVGLEVSEAGEEAGERVLLVAEDVGGVVRVEQADDVQAEVALEPNYVRGGAVEDLRQGAGGSD